MQRTGLLDDGRYWPRAGLRELAAHLEGVPVAMYDTLAHRPDGLTDPDRIVGHIRRVRCRRRGVFAQVELTEAAGWLARMLDGDWRAGLLTRWGLSPVFRTTMATIGANTERPVRIFARVSAVIALDIVANPAGGGRFLGPASLRARLAHVARRLGTALDSRPSALEQFAEAVRRRRLTPLRFARSVAASGCPAVAGALRERVRAQLVAEGMRRHGLGIDDVIAQAASLKEVVLLTRQGRQLRWFPHPRTDKGRGMDNEILIERALKAYGIEPDDLMGPPVVREDAVCFVTKAALKLRWHPDTPVQPLTRGQRGHTVTCPAGHLRSADAPMCRQCDAIRVRYGGDAGASKRRYREVAAEAKRKHDARMAQEAERVASERSARAHQIAAALAR